MAKRNNEFQSLGDALNEMLSENKLQKGIDQINIKEAWQQVMGNGVMTYTQKIELRGDKLYVWLTSSALREELSYGTGKIATMINSNVNKSIIKEVRLL